MNSLSLNLNLISDHIFWAGSLSIREGKVWEKISIFYYVLRTYEFNLNPSTNPSVCGRYGDVQVSLMSNRWYICSL